MYVEVRNNEKMAPMSHPDAIDATHFRCVPPSIFVYLGAFCRGASFVCVLARSHKQIVRYAHSCVRSMYLENLFYAASNLCYGRELRLLERKLYAYTLLDNEVNTVTACIYTHNRITRARARTLIVISKSKMDKMRTRSAMIDDGCARSLDYTAKD